MLNETLEGKCVRIDLFGFMYRIMMFIREWAGELNDILYRSIVMCL